MMKLFLPMFTIMMFLWFYKTPKQSRMYPTYDSYLRAMSDAPHWWKTMESYRTYCAYGHPNLPPNSTIWMPSAAFMMVSPLIVLTNFPLFHQHSPSEYMTLDPMSASLVILCVWVTALMIISSQKVLTMRLAQNKYLLLMVALCLTLCMSFTTINLASFYILFEASLVPMLFMVLGWGNQPERLSAAAYLVLYTVASSLPLLLALFYLYHSSNGLYMGFVSKPPESWGWGPVWLAVILAFLVKTPMYFLHLWLPKAHVQAPVAGSMALAALLLKLGTYGLIRVMYTTPTMMSTVQYFSSSLALMGGVYASVICLRQTDLKALVAYSSVAHMAPVLGGIFSNSSWGWHGASLMMVAHGLTSSGLFFLTNSLYEKTQTRAIFLTKGALMISPLMTTWWCIGMAANLAMPPSLSIFAEINLVGGCLYMGLSLIPVMILMLTISATYSLFMYSSINHGAAPSFMNPTKMLSSRDNTILMLHFFPLFSLALSTDLMAVGA